MPEASTAPEARFRERATRGTLAVEGLRMTSFTVMRTHVSVHLRGEIPRPEAADLLSKIAAYTGSQYAVRGSIEHVRSLYSVASFTSRRGIAIIALHTGTDPALLPALAGLLRAQKVTLTLGVPVEIAPQEPEENLGRLLARAAQITGRPPEDLLEQVTTFRNREGRTVPGRRSVDQLSPARAEVARKRLAALIHKVEATRR